MSKWQVKKDGETKCHGEAMKGFPDKRSREMLRAAGHKIFLDGKVYKEEKQSRK